MTTAQPAAERATPDHLPWRIGGTCGDATWIFDSESYTQAIIKGERHLDRARLIVRSVNQSAEVDALMKAARFALTTPGMIKGRDELAAALAQLEELRKGER